VVKYLRLSFFNGILCLVFLYSFNTASFAQTSELRGVVHDKETGEAMLYTGVYLQGTKLGANTDVNGFYIITKIPPGDYTLICASVGYDTFKISISVGANKKLNQNIFLKPSTVTLNEVNVTQTKTEKETRSDVAKTEITPDEIRAMPAVGGAADLAQYLQMLPGVVSTGDQGGQLYIAGGTPVENKVLLDGMTVYNPFHSIGLFSVFDVDIIKNVDVYSAGFGGEFGDAISSVMDVTTRDGNKSKISGDVDVNPFVSKISLEGPLSKYSEDKGGSSFIVSLRSSYLKESAPTFYPYVDSGTLPYTFTDIFGKLTFYAPGGSKVNFFGFDFKDDVDFPNSVSYGWQSYGGGLNFLLIPSAYTSTEVEGHFDYSTYQMNLLEQDGLPRFSQIGGFQAGMDFSYFPNQDLIKYGFEVDGLNTNFQFYNSDNREISQLDYTTELAAYVKYNKVIGRFILDPSIRFTSYVSLSEFTAEPRMDAKFLISGNWRLKGAAGIYSQNLFSAQSDQDVVNLFYGYLTGPDVMPATFNGQPVNSRLQKAWHVVGGLEGDLGKHATVEVSSYYKDFTQLINVNPNLEFDNTPEYASQPNYLKEPYIVETGKAYGLDFQFKYTTKPFYVWIVYSLGWVTRFDSVQTYYTNWDRRDNINVLATYNFSKNRSWAASVRWNFGTPFPFTQTQGYYELLDFQQGGINTNYTQQNGKLGVLLAAMNEGRMSDYHRLDISLNKSWKLKNGNTFKLTVGTTNVYNRNNVFYVNRETSNIVYQLPIMPSIDISYAF